MTGAERGFLLLCSRMGDPGRKILTTAQFRKLSQRIRAAAKPAEDRDMTPGDLMRIGYGPEDAHRIITLLSEEARLDHYLTKARKAGCHLLTPFSGCYPRELEKCLGDDAPAVLWYRGNPQLLHTGKIALVGSRDLLPENTEFARQAGIEAAAQGFTLVSGNARGADRTAQDSCLDSGGQVISIVADALTDHAPSERVLYLCEDSFDLGFSAVRALSRNRLIHAMGVATLVAQSSLKTGGTWDGSVKNLRCGWSPLCCFDDGRDSTRLLVQMGASAISMNDLKNLGKLSHDDQMSF